MAFSISYEGLTRGNIRHIYSYKASEVFIPSPRPYGKTTQFLPQPLTARFPPRFFDYYPAFDIGLPRAPAFDRRSPGEIRTMVDRMQKPLICQRERGRTKSEGQEKRSRPRKVKVVRFQSPAASHSGGERGNQEPSSSSHSASQDADADVTDHNEVKDNSGEEKDEDRSRVKDTEEKAKVGEKKRSKHKKKKQNKGSDNRYTGFLPPINN